MEKKRRTPKKGMAMDGFVRRGSSKTPRRASLQSQSKSRTKRTDGFVPRQAGSSQPLQFNDDQWADDNTLNMGAPDLSLEDESLAKSTEKNPHVWQVFKKRRLRKGKPEPSRRRKIFKRVALVIVIIGLIIGGFLGWKLLKATSKVFQGNVLGFFDSTKLKGESEGRVNVLLAGTSEDDEGHGGADLTDSIMIASVDVKNNTAFTVSIPRDLWVKYGEKCSAGYEGKINVAYQCGEDVDFKEAGYFEGGMGLLQKIISTNLGIPIHYYGKISYTAFKDSVDAVGGIDITIKTDDPRGIMDRNFDWQCRYKCYKVKYPNGPVHLNGEQALLLARARGANGNNYGTGNDFGRTERQRQMLVAVKKKALSSGVIANPAKLGDLLDAAGDNVKTNFKSNEVRRVYDLSKLVKDSDITSVDLVADEDPLVTTGNYNGQSIVRPTAGIYDYSDIKTYFKKITTSNALVKEDAGIVVLNGSGAVGLAQEKADVLTAKGLDVIKVSNAGAQTSTIIIDKTGGKKPKTKAFLEKQFGVSSTTNPGVAPEGASYTADFIVILGKSTNSSAN